MRLSGSRSFRAGDASNSRANESGWSARRISCCRSSRGPRIRARRSSSLMQKPDRVDDARLDVRGTLGGGSRHRRPPSRGAAMNDTAPEVAARYRALIMRRSGSDRLGMACEMFDCARQLMIAWIKAEYRAEEVGRDNLGPGLELGAVFHERPEQLEPAGPGQP